MTAKAEALTKITNEVLEKYRNSIPRKAFTNAMVKAIQILEEENYNEQEK